MKLITIITCWLITPFTLAQKVEDFSWLEGIWERANLKPGSSAYESWKLADHSLAGLGVRLKESDTVFVEKLSIVETEEGLSYVAEVDHNASAVYFKITEYDESSFISENPKHDFPKMIAYKLNEGKLTVTISGDGKSIPFVFQKTD